MTNPLQTTDRLHRVVSDLFGVSPSEIDEDTSPDSIAAWDSVGHLQLIMAVEAAFGVEIPIDQVVGLNNVRSLREVLSERGAEL